MSPGDVFIADVAVEHGAVAKVDPLGRIGPQLVGHTQEGGLDAADFVAHRPGGVDDEAHIDRHCGAGRQASGVQHECDLAALSVPPHGLHYAIRSSGLDQPASLGGYSGHGPASTRHFELGVQRNSAIAVRPPCPHHPLRGRVEHIHSGIGHRASARVEHLQVPSPLDVEGVGPARDVAAATPPAPVCEPYVGVFVVVGGAGQERGGRGRHFCSDRATCPTRADLGFGHAVGVQGLCRDLGRFVDCGDTGDGLGHHEVAVGKRIRHPCTATDPAQTAASATRTLGADHAQVPTPFGRACRVGCDAR